MTHRISDRSGKVDDEEFCGTGDLWNTVVRVGAMGGMALLDERIVVALFEES